MDISSKASIHYNEKLRREYEIVCLFVRKIGISKTRNGEITSNSRSVEPLSLQRVTSNDCGDYIVKKSLSDGVVETGSYTQITTAKGHGFANVKDNRDTYDANNNQLCKHSDGSTKKGSLTETRSSNGEKGGNEKIGRELDLEAREASRKQIEDFFTDPVDREIFPLNAPETPSTRTFRPIEIPTAEESISAMLGKFSAALWEVQIFSYILKRLENKRYNLIDTFDQRIGPLTNTSFYHRDRDFMREVYEYRRLPRPPARGLPPLFYEWLTLNTYSGLMQSTYQEDTGESQDNSKNIQQTFDTEIKISKKSKNQTHVLAWMRKRVNFEHLGSFDSSVVGQTPFQKKNRRESGKKRKEFLSA